VFDPKTFVGEFGYTFANDTFTVTLSDEQAASISGLEGNTFFVTVPVNDPAKLSIKYPTKYETGGDRLYILVGDEFDLSTIVFADANAKVDFKDGLVYKSSKENKLEVEGSILTALDEWNGTITVSYLNADFDETVSATIEVSAVYDADEIPEDTGNEAVTGVSKGIGYADGSLELKGFGGEIASVYGLNGGIIVSFAVDSDDASFLLNLPKGFYVVKAGAEVSKFIVK
jgi:hypothetical protein